MNKVNEMKLCIQNFIKILALFLGGQFYNTITKKSTVSWY